MSRYNPSLIILHGDFASEISETTQRFIRERLHLSELPPIFQFLPQQGEKCNTAEIATAYNSALSKRAAAHSANLLQRAVDSSRIETFLVGPLTAEFVKLAGSISTIIGDCALDTLSGGRNAIFLLSRQQLSFEDGIHEGAIELDKAMGGKDFPFSRCFFIDEVNELGQTLTLRSDTVDLVSNFIVLAIASELSDVLKVNPPPYDGAQGSHHKAYGSFSCNRIGFRKERLISGAAQLLARDLSQQLHNSRVSDDALDELLTQSAAWFRNSRQSLEERLRKAELARETGRNGNFQSTSVMSIQRLAQLELDQFTDRVIATLAPNLGSLSGFLNRCLERWLVELEELAEQVRTKRSEIVALSIDDMLGLQRTETYQEEIPQQAKWWQFGAKPKPPIFVQHSRVVDTGKALNGLIREYSLLSAVLDIHVALFARLDMASINLELMSKHQPTRESNAECQSIFDLDLVDDDLIENFYRFSYQARGDESLREFLESDQFRLFKNELFSYPEGQPLRHLLAYCSSCFQFIANYGVEKIYKLKRSLADHKEFLYLSTPFWKPLSSATGERVLVVCRDARSEFDLKTVLDSRNVGTNEIYVDSDDAGSITVVQISYGVKIHEVAFPP